jgi:hypothetical protein
MSLEDRVACSGLLEAARAAGAAGDAAARDEAVRQALARADRALSHWLSRQKQVTVWLWAPPGLEAETLSRRPWGLGG